MSIHHRWITGYLQDHFAASVAGTALFHRVAASHSDARVRQAVAALAEQITNDQNDLNRIMDSLRIRHNRPKEILTGTMEKLGRLKTNGTVFKRSPLTDVVELEALSLAVQGKALGWKTLLAVAQTEPSLDASQVQTLLDRADAQQARLEELRLARASEVFSDRPASQR